LPCANIAYFDNKIRLDVKQKTTTVDYFIYTNRNIGRVCLKRTSWGNVIQHVE